MKLLKIYVENFGCLEKYTKDFTNGVNVIEEENGFGKTTLANFIKAMFYGFTNIKKSYLDNDRLRYAPWQGGVFGGYLDFELNSKKYRIERTFNPVGSTKDTFKLYDLDTNKPSKDFSKNIGEEIFKVDVEGFIRSIYIPQSNIEWSDKKLSQNLTNMLEGSSLDNDIANAIKSLEAESKKYVKTGNKGLIAETQSKISELEEKVEIADLSKDNTKVLKLKLQELTDELEKRVKELSSIKEEIKKANKQHEKEAIYNHYKSLTQNIGIIKKELDLLNTFFKEKYPTKEQINYNYALLEELSLNQSELNKINSSDYIDDEYNRLKEYFKNYPDISEDIIKEKIKENDELKKLSIEKESISNEIDKVENKVENETVLTSTHKMIYILLAFLSGILLIPGIVILVDTILRFNIVKLLLSISFILLGICFGVISLIIFIVRVNKNHQKLQKFKKLEEDCKKEKEELIKKYSILESEYNLLNSKVKDFVIKFEKINDSIITRFREDADYLIELNNINNSYKNYNKLRLEYSKKQERIALVKEKYESIKDELLTFTKYYLEDAEPFQALKLIQFNCDRYESLYTRLNNANKELEEFLKTNVVDEDISTNVYNLQELEKQETSLENKISKLSQEKLVCENNIQNNEQAIDSLFELESQIAVEKDLLAEYTYKYNVITKTIEFLNKAEEKLSSNYLSSIEKNFKKYMDKLVDKNNNFSLTTDLDIVNEEKGSFKELGYYSSGYQDIVTFCARLALIKAIFKDTLPPLVLDDPFANLDKKKLSLVKDMLVELANEYQIIYLICHESRNI